MLNSSISSSSSFSVSQKAVLKRGNISTLSDLILLPTQDVARRCKVSPLEIKAILEVIYKSSTIAPKILGDCLATGSYQACTSGDQQLDTALGGGFRTGMIWEVVGESASGKTQLALRMSLLSQLSEKHKGLSGSTCYMITSGKLPTARILQIAENHPLLSSCKSECGLDDIHTMPVPTIDALIQGLTTILPKFIEDKLQAKFEHPEIKLVKIIVIDALGELFHSAGKTSTSTLVERSQNIAEISLLLHSIASKYGLVVLVLNEVVDSFNRDVDNAPPPPMGLSYAEQSRWFGRANSLPGEDRKEASLGLVWANQVNARIMLSRTGRRRYIDSGQFLVDKRARLSNDKISHLPDSRAAQDDELIRRLSVIFNSISAPTSLDYIVTVAGLVTLGDENASSIPSVSSRFQVTSEVPNLTNSIRSTQLAPLDVGFVENNAAVRESDVEASLVREEQEDEWDKYWEKDEITEEMYIDASLKFES